jgi:hypothetical protein
LRRAEWAVCGTQDVVMANDGNVEHSVELLLQLGLKDDVPNPNPAQELPPPPALLQRAASHNSQAALDAVARFEADESLARELWAADQQLSALSPDTPDGQAAEPASASLQHADHEQVQ